MSYKATDWAYGLPLAGSQKFVLVALADMADEAQSCYPGLERISAMTGMSVATVRRGLAKLEQSGLIRHERRNRSNGSRTSNRYFLSVGADLALNSPSAHPATESKRSSCTDLALTVQEPSAHIEQGKEPSVKPSEEPLGESAPNRGKKPSSVLADDWTPSAANSAFAKENRIDLPAEIGQFKAHAEANDKRQVNWDAAFRLWLGNVVKWRKPENAPKVDPNAWMQPRAKVNP